jgi:hypothetical protein
MPQAVEELEARRSESISLTVFHPSGKISIPEILGFVTNGPETQRTRHPRKGSAADAVFPILFHARFTFSEE